MKKKTYMLVIFDGFGIRKEKKDNAILNANMKNYFSLWDNYPHTQLHASGELVGIPKGQIGSSEIGHLTMGAGRLIKQPIVRINEDIKSKKFFKNPELVKALIKVNKSKGNVHLMGLLGPGGVHSEREHLYALMEFFDKNISKVKGKIYIHNFLDGRDVAQKSALGFLKHLDSRIKKLKNSKKFVNSTICGRYYAMDRDKRMDRTKLAFDMLVKGFGDKFDNYKSVIESSYKNKVYDEFVTPSILDLEPITKEDLCVFYNFRADRPRQLVSKLLKKFPKINFLTLTNYSDDFKVHVLYKNDDPKKTFGEVISKKKMTQLRIAESEKFPHVTYFFNGLNFDKSKGEKQIKIPSPKVATYDLQPEMNADKVTKTVIKEIKSQKHDFILLNFANSDMVGHTGSHKATVKALKTLDVCLGDIKKALDSVDGTLMITADHGNCEEMKDKDGNPGTKHTLNRVPFVLCDNSYKLRKDYSKLSLFNIAPTILEIMGVKKPKEMTGESLIKK